ncbi:MAG: pilus assembly PilX N-terminal domain-containing protein [Deltaproteobacteria bacterium]|nr:pilus assembly PilX N-terminal domain-containing protein [Deltaproteobacteria bacterium]
MRRLSDTKCSLPLLRPVNSHEDGAALIIGLMFLAILALVGSTAMVLTSTDLQIGGNFRVNTQAFNAAQGGLEEARERLKGTSSTPNFVGDPAATPNAWWSAYIRTDASWQVSDDPTYDSNYDNNIHDSLQSDIPYFVKIRHKREYDAEQAGHTVSSAHYYDGDGATATHTQASPGNIVYYGYGDATDPAKACQFTGTAGAGSTPVEIITAYKKSGSEWSKALELEVVRPIPPPITSTLYSKGDITFNGGGSQNVYGEDNCGSAGALPPAYTKDPSVSVENSTPDYTGDPAEPVEGSTDIDISGYLEDMKDSATIIITSDQNGATYGSSTDFVSCYCDATSLVGGLKLQNVTGYGVLLVEGDLTLGGGFNWSGIVLVTGTLTFNGGGSGINIFGAVLANQTIDINGGLDLRYDSCMISSSFINQPLKSRIWLETSMTMAMSVLE